MKKTTIRRLAGLLALVLLCAPLAACQQPGSATTMHLLRADGQVDVQNDKGKSLPAAENLGLYHGYQLGTQAASYAWIDLDSVKLAKLDEASEIEILKTGKALEIDLHSGSVFFNVTEPLADDETMAIRTTTMVVGIRGTCGWVSTDGATTTVALLEGEVSCQATGGETLTLQAGQMAVCDGSQITVSSLQTEDIPAFVYGEADAKLETALAMAQELAALRELEEGGPATPPANQGDLAEEGLAAMQPPPLPDDGIARTVVEAADTAALLALAEGDLSNTEIHLGDGEYDVGDLSISGASNLSIIGTGKTKLVSHWGGDIILYTSDCDNLLLYGLVLGHDLMEEMSCDAGVLSLFDSNGLQIVYCDIYGCGVVGLTGNGNATLQSTIVRDCSEGAVSWSSGALVCKDCVFTGNSYQYEDNALFRVVDTQLTLDNCVLQNNRSLCEAGFQQWDEGAQAVVWQMDATSSVNEIGCTIENNGWQ